MVAITASQVERLLGTTDGLLTDLGQTVSSLHSRDMEDAEASLTGRLQAIAHASRFPAIGVTNAVGDIIAGAPFESRMNVSRRQYFIAHQHSPALGAFIGAPIMGVHDTRLSIPMSRRIGGGDGVFTGVVFAALSRDALLELLGDLSGSSGAEEAPETRDSVLSGRSYDDAADLDIG